MKSCIATALLGAALLGLPGCGGGGGSGGDVTVVTPFVVLADVAGAPLGKMLVPGVAITTTMESGDTLQLKASPAGMQWIVTSDGNTIAAEASSDGASWRATIQSPKGGELTILMQSTADPAQQATLKLLVNPHRYTRADWRAGEARTWREVVVRNDGTGSVETRRHVTTAVAADGSHTVELRNEAGATLETLGFDADHNRLRQQQPAGTCLDTPRRAMLDFPLYVGKSWQANWQTQCTQMLREKAEAATVVQDHGRITVPAGSFDALKLRSVIAYRDVLDPGLAGGVIGQAQYAEERVCWWSTQLRRMVKCDISFSYLGGAPGDRPKTVVQELVSAQ